MDTRELILKTIDEMAERGEKLNIHAVAKRCGISHSLIYNRYPDLKEKIKNLGKVQRAKVSGESDAAAISDLVAENQLLSEKIKAQQPAKYRTLITELVAHLHQVYAMYDQLLEDRNALARRLQKPENEAERQPRG